MADGLGTFADNARAAKDPSRIGTDASRPHGHILIVDDELVIRELVRRTLSAAGHAVVTANDGKMALEQLGASDFDVVVSDMRMPGMDGLGLLEAIRNTADDVEVIILTGNVAPESVIAVLREGAFDYVEKPFHPSDLVATVDRALRRRELRTSTALHRASQRILSTTEPSKLPAIIVEVTRQVMAADDVSLMLYEPGRGLHIAYAHGLSSEIQAEVHLDLGERVAGRVAASGKPTLLNGNLGTNAQFADLSSYQRVHSSIVYPLCRGNDVLGVLNINRVTHPRPYRWQDVERASVLAAQALLALENRRLLHRLVGQERLSAVGEVAAGIAHEINNPLNYVLGSLESLANDLATVTRMTQTIASSSDAAMRAQWDNIDGSETLTEMRSALSDVQSGAHHIRDIVSDLRLLAREGRSAESTIDVNEALRSALRIAGSAIRCRAKLVTNLCEGLLVRADVGRLAQVMLNLLVNATQALDSERPSGNVITATTGKRADGHVTVTIEDNGCGIRSEDMPHLFQPFFTTKAAATGTGLGLPISRDIVRQYGGDIEVTSEFGRGSSFRVVLPQAGKPTPTGEDASDKH